MNNYIELINISKIYNQQQSNEVIALSDINLSIKKGSVVCLEGASGSGKTTLLAILGCVFQPTNGRVAINNQQITRLPDRFMTSYRRENIGFIFQHFNLLKTQTVLENVIIPLLPLGLHPKQCFALAKPLLKKFRIFHRKDFPAGQISGGELQRTAIVRALINNPPVILADEPTAHLDKKTSLDFMEMMESLKSENKTIIITSHDQTITNHRCIDRIIKINDGILEG